MISFLYQHYKEDPNPTYEPQKKIANKPIAAVPTKVPINHNGIRPVVPELDIKKKNILQIKSKTNYLFISKF